jgi:hypothetical protein
MIGNISLLIISFMFMCVIMIYLSKKWPDLDIFDLFIIFILLHFGFVPFLRGLYFGKDIVFDFRHSNPLAIGLVFGHILVILLIVRGTLFFLPRKLGGYLKIDYLIEKSGWVNKYILLIVWAFLVSFPIISYLGYGVKPYIMPRDFEKIGVDLPYWFTSIRTIYNYISFCVFLGLFGNVVKSKKNMQIFWSTLIAILVLAITIYGRRFFINMIVVWVVFWLIYKKERILRLRYVTGGLLLVVFFILVSNFYQTYRHDILFNAGKINAKQIESPILAALNYHSTLHNMQVRAGTWEFNFLVFNQQLNRSGITTDGNLTWEAFKSTIPRYFWPGKRFTLIDDYLASFFMVSSRDVNIAKNIFGIVQLDFGYYSLIIIPTVILIILCYYIIIVKLMCGYPAFMIMISGNIIWYLINFEANGNEIFTMLRNLIIILGLFVLYILAYRAYCVSFKGKIDSI